MSTASAIKNMGQEYVAFVTSLNVEGISAEKAISAIREEAKKVELNGGPVGLFYDVTYDWLWCKPESLMRRREDGELDGLFLSHPFPEPR